MSNELENLIIVIDTREQNQVRIKAVEDWAVSHGAIVEHSKLDLCDYQLIGEFRGVSVNIGIEAKSLSDFATSYSELSDKLARAYQLYDDVGLFVESANYTFTPDTDNFHATIDNPAVRNGKADVLSYHVYKNMLDSFAREGVHVRELRSAAAFPYDIAGILINISKELHTGLAIKDKSFISLYLNVLAKLPHIGYIKANKLKTHYPNLNWLCGASEDSYKTILGEKTGRDLYAFIRCHELETEEWRNSYHRNGTEKDELDQVQKYGDGAQTLVKSCAFATPDPKKHAECKTPDHFKQHSKIPSHAEGTILSNHNHPLPSADTFPSHPDRTHSQIDSTIPKRSGDIPQPPITETTAVKQEGLSVSFFPPAEIDIGLDDKPLECVIKCRACHQTIDDCNDDETGFCQDPDCIKIRKEPSLENKLRIFLREPHTVEEIVEEYGCSTGYTHQVCTANVKSGNIKKVTEQDGRVTFQRIIC